ncbi:MAG: amidase [Ahrensia sp.]|nr:amidase [Ahrensia sp.]
MQRPGGDLNAWCDYPYVDVPHAAEGPLAGKTLAVKDLMQLAGYRNGWGSPSRLAQAQIDTETQSAVQAMLDAGAKALGKAQCEELCFSLAGNNAHFGMPANGAAPERLTGGSSSGSVSLISNGAIDIATGSDTGGSVRGPASFCGLVGLRTTHGRIALDHTMPLAPSLDCFGWFTRAVSDYATVGALLLGEDVSNVPLARLIGAEVLDTLMLGHEERAAFAPALARVEEHFGSKRAMVPLGYDIETAYWAFRNVQAWEAHQSLGGWIAETKPNLGPGVKDRFDYGASLSRETYDKAVSDRADITSKLSDLLGEDGVLVLPTVPSCAPLRSVTHEDMQAFREQAIRLLCHSGLSGFPQITLPLATVHDAPFGLSLLGPKGSDRRLIDIAVNIMI